MSSIRWRIDKRLLVARLVRVAAASALTDGANELLRKANQTVPKEEGILEGSGTVDPATPGALIASVGYGGEASAYAAKQHEDTSLRHDAGRRAKWLERTLQEDGERVMSAVAESMRSRLP